MNAISLVGVMPAVMLTLLAASIPGAAAAQAPVQPESGRTLTAEALARWVIDANPALASAQAAAEAAARRVEPAGSLEDPMLSYSMAPLTASEGLDQAIDLSQEIPWPGTLAARDAAARYEAEAVARDVDSLQLQIVALARSAHAEWRYIDEALDAHRAIRSLLDDLLATAGMRYAAGKTRRLDVLQAEVERADLDNRILHLLRERATIRARINALLGRPPDAPLPPATPITVEPPPPSLGALKTLVLAQHPDLSRLNAEISASESRVTLAEKAFFPNFQVGVGYSSLWESVDQRPLLGISINVPLYRGRRRADLDRARAETRRERYSLEARRAELLADLATAHAATIQARKSIALYRERLVPLAEQYLGAALTDYRSGAGTFLDVITAEQRKLQTDLELARALSDYARHHAELVRWAGGSFESRLPTSAGATS